MIRYPIILTWLVTYAIYLGEMKFPFGQHKGKPFIERALRDPGYHVRYMQVLRKLDESPPAELTTYISWFKNGNGQFTFGIYRGKTFKEVSLEDTSYHQRFMAVNDTLRHPEMVRYIEYLNQHGEQACKMDAKANRLPIM